MRITLENLGNVISWQDSKRVTAQEISEKTKVVSAYLRSIGISSGDKVIIYHGGDADFFINLFGVWEAGACAVCLNPNLTESELENIISFVEPALLLTKSDNTQGFNLNVKCIDTENIPSFKNDAVYNHESSFDDDALMLFTSGTTGTPKGVVHTFRSLMTRIALNQANIPISSMRTTLCVLPMHFGHGLIGNCLTPLLAGCDLILAPGTNLYVATELGKIIDEYKINFMSSVPTLWKKVISKSEKPKLKTLKRIHIGSAPLSSELWNDVIKWADTRHVLNMYGITETANWIAGASAVDYEPADGLIGRMWGGVAAVLTEENKIAMTGTGELIVQPPSLLKEYYKAPEKTSEVLKEGWYHTGDIGCIDIDGTIRLTGRLKYEINRAGIKVYPEDIDLLLERHPEVREACAFSIPDEIEGETIGVAVSLIENSSIDISTIRDWCANRLSKEKVPVKWFIEDEIPKTDRGKLNRQNVSDHCLKKIN